MNDQAEAVFKSARPQRAGSATGVWLGSILVIVATLGVLAVLAYWKYLEIQAAMKMGPPPEMSAYVGIQPIGKIVWRNSTGSTGTIMAPRSITVNNELPGTVSEVLFQSGQIVEEGMKLLELDSSVENARLKAAMARAQFALTTLERSRQMAASNAIAANELDEIESRWRQTQAEVEELRAIIARKTIVAPFRARVGLSDVQKGQYLNSGSLITTLQGVENHLLVEFTLAQSVVNQIQSDATVEVTVAGEKLSARITAIDAQADRQTRNVRIRATLHDPPKSMSVGDSVPVKIEFGPQIELPAVPAEAVRRSPQGTFVFLAIKNEAGELRASAQSITPATSVGSKVGIASGVSVDDQVVVEGSFKLLDGALIAPAEITTPTNTGK
jgi:membrane fusion protein, multidrug efflux system